MASWPEGTNNHQVHLVSKGSHEAHLETGHGHCRRSGNCRAVRPAGQRSYGERLARAGTCGVRADRQHGRQHDRRLHTDQRRRTAAGRHPPDRRGRGSNERLRRRPSLVGGLGSGGQFPVSIAVHGDQVFVLNAWGGASVAGFRQFGGYLIPVPSWTRDLGLQTSSSTVFTATPGQIGFTPDGSQLVVTTKNAADTVDVFRDGLFGPSAEPTVTSLPGAGGLRGRRDPAGRDLPGSGAGPRHRTRNHLQNTVATFAIAPSGRLTQLVRCSGWTRCRCRRWRRTAPGTVTEPVSVREPPGDGAVTLQGTTPTDAGTVDAAVSSDGQYLYVQAGGPGNVDACRIKGTLQRCLSVGGSRPVWGRCSHCRSVPVSTSARCPYWSKVNPNGTGPDFDGAVVVGQGTGIASRHRVPRRAGYRVARPLPLP